MHALDRALHAYLLGKGRRLVTRAEVIAHAGEGNTKLADALIKRRKEQGRWFEVQPGVYLVGLGPLTPHEECVAVLLAVPPPAGVSQLCAFLEWGLDGIATAPLEITVRHETNVNVVGDVIVHRSRKHEGFVGKDDLVVTSVERTLLESAPRLSRHALEQGFASAWRRGLTTPVKTLAYLDEHGSARRPGTKQLLAVVSLYADGQRAPGSVAEVTLLDLLRPELMGVDQLVR